MFGNLFGFLALILLLFINFIGKFFLFLVGILWLTEGEFVLLLLRPHLTMTHGLHVLWHVTLLHLHLEKLLLHGNSLLEILDGLHGFLGLGDLLHTGHHLGHHRIVEHVLWWLEHAGVHSLHTIHAVGHTHLVVLLHSWVTLGELLVFPTRVLGLLCVESFCILHALLIITINLVFLKRTQLFK